MNAQPFDMTPRRRRLLVWAALVLVAVSVAIVLRLALHRVVPCGSGMSPAMPSACSGPVTPPATLPSD